jgi:NADH-quinone oxidoreductase subunit L
VQPGYLVQLLRSSEPAHVAGGLAATGALNLNLPSHAQVHAYHATAGTVALLIVLGGTVFSYAIYVSRVVDPAAIARQMAATYNFLVEKWQFDNLYDVMFARPVHVVARWCQVFDLKYIDGFLHAASRFTVQVSRWDRVFDEGVIDRTANVLADGTYAVGRSLRVIQTGRLRQYIVFIAVSVLSLFILVFAFLPR